MDMSNYIVSWHYKPTWNWGSLLKTLTGRASPWQAAYGRGDFGQVHQRNELSQVGEALGHLGSSWVIPEVKWRFPSMG